MIRMIIRSNCLSLCCILLGHLLLSTEASCQKTQAMLVLLSHPMTASTANIMAKDKLHALRQGLIVAAGVPPQEILRVLKPGKLFVGYEWCSTSKYNPANPKQREVMADIEIGNGLPDVRSTDECKQALQDAGFELLEVQDLVETADIPWYEPLDPQRMSLSSFRTTRIGRMLTRAMVFGMEKVGIAPAGSRRVASFLERAGDSLTEGGKLGIFTPMYFFVARRPQ